MVQATLTTARARGKSGWLRQYLTALSVAAALALGLGPAGAALAGPGATALTAQDIATWRAAFQAADAERWDDARRLAAGAAEPLLSQVLRWQELSKAGAGHAGFAEISAFIQRHGSWPNLPGLRRLAELALTGDEPAAQMRDWFGRNPPLTAAGIIALAEALVAANAEAKAMETVRRFWMDTDLRPEDESLLQARLGTWLRPRDHALRLERLLWDQKADPARRMLPLVDEEKRQVAEVRLAFMAGASGAEGLLRQLPVSLQRDQGVLYERIRVLRRRNDMTGAQELLAAAPAELARPAPWWAERHGVARHVLEQGDAALAYRLARDHGQKDGQTFTEAEFFAGWIALRRLRQPDTALVHFRRLIQASSSPITRSRGGYWAGRAAEAGGDSGQARESYLEAARFGTTFYGQLAQVSLGQTSLRLPAEPTASAAETAAFDRDERVRIIRLLSAILPRDSEDRAGLFFRRLLRDSSEGGGAPFVLAATLAADIHRPDLAVAAARQAAQQGYALITAGYPVVDLQRNAGIEPALALALIRQESSFNPAIVSSAGARGLMQLMPATAKRTAQKVGLRLDVSPQTLEDPGTNIHLGTAYFAEVLSSFAGAPPLAIAAYNAGPSRVNEWLNRFGDPRSSHADPVDWIESIPFSETRNYVQRVLEGAQVYRARLGSGRADRSLARDLGLRDAGR